MKSKSNLYYVLGIVAVLVLWGSCSYNGMVTAEEEVAKSWNNVQSQYQRRADLIPNLVNVVKGYAAHEKETFEAVVAARTKATQITVDPENLTPEKLKEFQQAQGEVGSALGRLLAITENYPDLKANENFKELQAQLEGTENRIAVTRNEFNEAVQKYNVKVRKFPGVIFAKIFGFDPKEGFQADAGAEHAPKVQF